MRPSGSRRMGSSCVSTRPTKPTRCVSSRTAPASLGSWCAPTSTDATACSSRRGERGRSIVAVMTDELDVDAMLTRFRERAQAVQERPLPPVAGPQREQFIAQAQLDFQDFAIIGDATWEFADGVLTLRINLSG